MTAMIGKICIAIAMLAPAAALAETQSVTESAQYTLADNDSRNDARQICASTAKRTALDKAGSLFESDLTAHKAEEANGAVADDTRLQMRSYVAAVVASEVVDEHFDVNDGRLTVSCTVRITFDPDEVGRKLQDIAGNAELRRKLAAQQAQMDILESQVRALSNRIKSSSRDPAADPPAAISNPALDQPAPPPQVVGALPPLPPPRPVPPPQAQGADPPVRVYPPLPARAYPPPPVPAYYYYNYYYRPVPGYAAPYAYAPRVAYPGWYYAPRW